MLLNQSGENEQNAQILSYNDLILSQSQATSPLFHNGGTNFCRTKDNAPAFGMGGNGEIFYCHTIKNSQLSSHLEGTKLTHR